MAYLYTILQKAVYTTHRELGAGSLSPLFRSPE